MQNRLMWVPVALTLLLSACSGDDDDGGNNAGGSAGAGVAGVGGSGVAGGGGSGKGGTSAGGAAGAAQGGSGGSSAGGAGSGGSSAGASGGAGTTGGSGAGMSGSSGQSGAAGASTGGVAGASGAGGAGSAGAGGGTSMPTALTGYWVWSKQIENGAVKLTVTEDDLQPKVGSMGWPGCPDGIVCTHYGIYKVAFGANGRFHHQENYTTSSDVQTFGTYQTPTSSTATFEREQYFSCAHPEVVNMEKASGTFRYKFVDNELWLSVSGFGGFALADDGNEPTRWLVYRSVSRQDYYGKYMIRICQPHDGIMCQPGCTDDSLIDEEP